MVLCAGMLAMVWLPLNRGFRGRHLMFVILFGVRLAFGCFAAIWTPRAVRVLARRLREHDYAARMCP